MDNLSDQLGLLTDDFIEECSDDSDDPSTSKSAPLREQDRFLPIANIAKIMKRAIPDNGKVHTTSIHPHFLLINIQDLISLYLFRLDCKRGARMHTRVCVRVYIVYHIRGKRTVPKWKAQNHQRRRHSFCDERPRLWQLCGAVNAVLAQISWDYENRPEYWQHRGVIRRKC